MSHYREEEWRKEARSQCQYLTLKGKILFLDCWGCNCTFNMNPWQIAPVSSLTWVVSSHRPPMHPFHPFHLFSESRHCDQYIQLKKFQVSINVSQRKLTYSLVVLWNLSFKTLNTISSFKWCLRGSWIYSPITLEIETLLMSGFSICAHIKDGFSAAGGVINQYKAALLKL